MTGGALTFAAVGLRPEIRPSSVKPVDELGAFVLDEKRDRAVLQEPDVCIAERTREHLSRSAVTATTASGATTAVRDTNPGTASCSERRRAASLSALTAGDVVSAVATVSTG